MDIEKALKRRAYCVEWRKRERQRLRKEHRCTWCKKKVKPKVTYPQFCEEHSEKNRKLKKEKK